MNTLDYLDVKTYSVSKEQVVLELIVSEKHLQPFGMLHGGISALLIETACSIGANCGLDNNQQIAVGLDIQTNHLSSAFKGDHLIITAKPDRAGKTIHVWQATIQNIDGKKISVGRCSLLLHSIT